MFSSLRTIALLAATTAVVASACAGCGRHASGEGAASRQEDYLRVATQIEYPNAAPASDEVMTTPPPHKIDSEAFQNFWDITLQDAIQHSLWNSQVLRDMGGTVVSNPTAARTVYESAIRESDPRFGVEAALSAFDAQVSSSAFWTKTDRALNNIFLGTGTRLLNGDTGTFQTQISKVAASGTQLTVRNNTIYDANNVPTNTFASAWDTNIEAEFRHPLLQGGGIEFNRIAGPAGSPGLFLSNGVLIARVNTDISLADFEASVRNAVSEVENAYWDLYYAYRDLDAKIAARNAALENWRVIYARSQPGTPGGEKGAEAYAREQYFIMQAAVEDAQSGGPGRGSLAGGGSNGGIFRGSGGVFAAERRLRTLIGNVPQSTSLLRPIDEPPTAEVVFDWHALLAEALATRVELRRQKWMIRRRELELTAARNFMLPRLDALGQYRWRGFGDDFVRYGNQPRFADAVGDLAGGDFQEWQFGVQFQAPLGFRQGFAAVRNGELQLARERAVLRDQEKQIAHDLSSAVGDVDRTFHLVRTAYNRREAAVAQVEDAEVQRQTAADKSAPQAALSEAIRRLADADSAYYRTLCDYAVALKNVAFESGSLLNHNKIALAEGAWAEKAYSDARRRAEDRERALAMSYVFNRPTIVSQGVQPSSVGGYPVETFFEREMPPEMRSMEVVPTPDGEILGLPPGAEVSVPSIPHAPPAPPIPMAAPAVGGPAPGPVVMPAVPTGPALAP
jgi:outer membrane protein TolC